MYPEYNKIQAFMEKANRLMSTSLTMEDIFNFSTKDNQKLRAFEFIDDNGKYRHYKYGKLRKHAYQHASVISNLLLQQPKNVPIVLKLANCPRWCEIFWAILMCGYKPLLIDAKTQKEGTQNLINQSHAIAIITDDECDYNVNKITISDIINEKPHYLFAPSWENEVIFCSSGTTGDVKLMIYNGENLCHQIASSLKMAETTKDIMYPKKYGKIKILAMIPFHHIFGFVAVFLWYTFYGKTIVFPSSINSKEIQDLCIKHNVTHVYSVPLFWDSLALQFERKKDLENSKTQELLDLLIGYNTGKLSKSEAGKGTSQIVKDTVQKKLLGNNIRMCISGGGYLDSKTATIINGVGYPLYNGYGMTEIGVTSVELSPSVEVRLRCAIGKPFNGVEYKISPTNKKDKFGELLIKSKAIHIREIIGGVEKETTLDQDGYFHSGDIAEIDKSGNYFIKGRIKDVIINADGENVFPDELELFYKDIPHLNNVCILGAALGNTRKESIVLVAEVDNKIKEDELKTLKDNIAEAGKNLPKGTKIDNVYFARGKLPLANNMKVKRFVIKKAIESNSKDYIALGEKKQVKKFNIDPKMLEMLLEPTRDLFSEVLILPKFKIDDSAHWVNDLGGDSMNYVELVQKLQERFNVEIPQDQYGQLTCVNDFVEEIAKLLKKSK